MPAQPVLERHGSVTACLVQMQALITQVDAAQIREDFIQPASKDMPMRLLNTFCKCVGMSTVILAG